MAPTFWKVQPSLPVTSIPDSIKYYTEVLGFRVAGRDRDDHTWLQMANNDEDDKWAVPVNLYLRRRGFAVVGDDVQFGKIHISIRGEDDELEQLLAKFKARGAKVLEEVTSRPWGLKDFSVTDHDGVSTHDAYGNILSFDQVLAGWKPPAHT